MARPFAELRNRVPKQPAGSHCFTPMRRKYTTVVFPDQKAGASVVKLEVGICVCCGQRVPNVARNQRLVRNQLARFRFAPQGYESKQH